ncbi:MAG: methyltransferase domain-containing protein [Candidatus Lokiarchaeota archaeon]|nr:methyltransferase domain-containing protein [Candidatus Lokiarchaeota archaeon]
MGKKPNLRDFTGQKALEYEQDKNLKKLQLETTLRSITLLNEDKNYSKDIEILDIGCGTGWTIEFLMENGYKNIVGIDNSEDMLNIAKIKGLEVFLADIIEGLAFPNDHFHAIISISVINFIVDDISSPKEYLNNIIFVCDEIYRVLKSGGRAVIQYFKNNSFEKAVSNGFKHAGFNGYIVIDDKDLRKEKRFFILDKE